MSSALALAGCPAATSPGGAVFGAVDTGRAQSRGRSEVEGAER